MSGLSVGEFVFEWDSAKDSENKKKHGISFKQAAALWFNPINVLDIADTRFAYDEERWIALGSLPEDACIIYVVAYCDRGDVIRIISARKAEKREKAAYHKRMQGNES